LKLQRRKKVLLLCVIPIKPSSTVSYYSFFLFLLYSIFDHAMGLSTYQNGTTLQQHPTVPQHLKKKRKTFSNQEDSPARATALIMLQRDCYRLHFFLFAVLLIVCSAVGFTMMVIVAEGPHTPLALIIVVSSLLRSGTYYLSSLLIEFFDAAFIYYFLLHSCIRLCFFACFLFV
jgi:hypothetical protein